MFNRISRELLKHTVRQESMVYKNDLIGFVRIYLNISITTRFFKVCEMCLTKNHIKVELKKLRNKSYIIIKYHIKVCLNKSIVG